MKVLKPIFLAIVVKIALLLMSGMSAIAQSQPGQWVEDLYLVSLSQNTSYRSCFIDEENNIKSRIPHIRLSTDFPINSKYLLYSYDSFWYDDAVYTVASGDDEKNENGSLFTRWTFAKWEEDKWHFLGDFKTDTETSLKAIPCRNNRFIVISNTDLSNNNKADRTPFHKMSLRSGRNEIGFDSSIDHGMDDLRKFMSEQTCFGLAKDSLVIMTDEYATLVNKRTGLYWVFSLEKASLVKAGMIFKQVTPEMIAKGGFSDAIFRAHPEKNGTILVSAQEESFLISETLNPVHDIIRTTRNLTWDEVQKLQAQRDKELTERNPFIIWYRIYPENGRVEKLGFAPEGADTIRNPEQPVVIWRPMPDGTVKMGDLDMMLENKDNRENETKKDSNKK